MSEQEYDGSTPGIDPDKLAVALEVLREVASLPPDHDDVRTMKRAASHMYKLIKKQRRAEIRMERQRHDQEIIERTATGSPMRIDDETAGIPLVSTTTGAFAGELITPRGCYICKQDYTVVDAFYHGLCPDCAAFSHTKRDQRTDLTGKRALLTGGRAKIGMYIALRLLRDGAHTTITTRFPKDAVRRFAAMDDSADWLHRLKIVGIDLRDPTQVVALTDDVTAARQRLSREGLAVAVEDEVSCCYAVQDKVWVDGPDHEPWEIYTVLADVEMPGGRLRTVDPVESMCCEAAPDSAARCR